MCVKTLGGSRVGGGLQRATADRGNRDVLSLQLLAQEHVLVVPFQDGAIWTGPRLGRWSDPLSVPLVVVLPVVEILADAAADLEGACRRDRQVTRVQQRVEIAPQQDAVRDRVLAALRDRKIMGAGLDVFEREPPPAGNPLLGMDNVLLTPHAAALTRACVTRMAVLAARRVLDVLQGVVPDDVANPEVLASDRWRHLVKRNTPVVKAEAEAG